MKVWIFSYFHFPVAHMPLSQDDNKSAGAFTVTKACPKLSRFLRELAGRDSETCT